MRTEMHMGSPLRNFSFGRENRRQSTKAEKILWEHLRNRNLGYTFRRQHPISDFIADFYCHECKLIIEIDGEYHNELEQQQYDKGRTYILNELKVTVIRFTNREVHKQINFVLDKIKEHITEYFDNDRE